MMDVLTPGPPTMHSQWTPPRVRLSRSPPTTDHRSLLPRASWLVTERDREPPGQLCRTLVLDFQRTGPVVLGRS